jgi:hypothetical protein
MEKPDLERMWQVWVKIGIPQSRDELFSKAVSIIKSHVSEVVTTLEIKKITNWYQFLIHGREDNNLYFHIRFSLAKGVDSKEFLEALPSYCLYAEPIKRKDVESIDGILKPLLRNEEIEEAWRIIGEQSEWVVNMLAGFKDGEFPIQQYTQFMHYYLNMMGLGMQGLLIMSPFFRF